MIMKQTLWCLPLALAACGEPPQGVGFDPYPTSYGAPQASVSSSTGGAMTELTAAEEKALTRSRPVVTRENGISTYSYFTDGFRKSGTPLSFTSAAQSAPGVGGKKATRSNVPIVADGVSFGLRRVTVDGYRFAVAVEAPGGYYRDNMAVLAPAVATRTGCTPTGRGLRLTEEYGAPGTYVMELRC